MKIHHDTSPTQVSERVICFLKLLLSQNQTRGATSSASDTIPDTVAPDTVAVPSTSAQVCNILLRLIKYVTKYLTTVS